MRMLGVSLVAYVLVYALNSTLGGYWGQPVAGNLGYGPGLRFHTAFLWQPRFGYRDDYDKDFLGWVFCPLIIFDQGHVHHRLDLANASDAALVFSKDKQIKWHPTSIKEGRRQVIEKALWQRACVENAEFCLKSAEVVHSKRDTHFMALLLFDAYPTNAVTKLQAFAKQSQFLFGPTNIAAVIKEVQSISNKFVYGIDAAAVDPDAPEKTIPASQP